MSETEKAPWQAAFEKKYRKAYWDRLPETSKQHHKEYYDACIAEHYRRLPPGDEGLAKCFNDALSRNNNSWYRWEDINADYRPSWLLAVGALQAALRQRGWLEPEEAETLKRYHELTKRNVTFWCERSRESAEVVDAQNARIAELEAEIGRLADQLNEAINDNEDANAELAALRARAECTITPDDAEAIAREHRDVCYAINKWRNTPWEDLEETDQRHRIEAMRRVLERRVGKVEPTAQPTPKQPTEAEIQAAIDARRDHFSDCEYRVKLRRLRHGPHVSMHKEASSLWTKHRRVPNLDWLDGYQQAALDLMRIQRWEKKQDKPCSCCNAEPSSFKVEMLPREITWREVAEAVQAADKNLANFPLAIKYVELTKGGWVIKVIEGGGQHSYATIDEALERLRDMAETETKPEPITPDAIWENEIYGFGYEELPTWVREAIKAEVERRNANGGE